MQIKGPQTDADGENKGNGRRGYAEQGPAEGGEGENEGSDRIGYTDQGLYKSRARRERGEGENKGSGRIMLYRPRACRGSIMRK